MSELLERSIATDGPCDVRFAFKCGATTVCWDLARLGPANLRVWKVPHRRTGGGGGKSLLEMKGVIFLIYFHVIQN